MALEGEVVLGSKIQAKARKTFLAPIPLCVIFRHTAIENTDGYSRIWRINIVNGHSPLNAAKCKASGLVLLVLEDGHTTVLHTG